MAHITCPKCGNVFDSSDVTNRVTPWVAAGAIGGTGAAVGAGIGLATGGVGMAATIPFGAAGAVIGFFGAKSFRKCPDASCGHIFRV